MFGFNKKKENPPIESAELTKQLDEQLTPVADASAPVDPAASQPQNAVPKKAKKKAPWDPIVDDFKHGIQDIKSVLAEGNYKLFAKQVVLVLLVFLGIRFFASKLVDQKALLSDKITAIAIQQANEEDYLINKDRLLHLEPIFPDIGKKNEWLLRAIMNTFEDHEIQPNIDGNVSEKSAETYTQLAQPVTFKQSFGDLGRFLADIENGEDFLRISNITITKITDTASLGKNTVGLRFNTVFPKEKYGPKLFKDYAKQMQQIKDAATSKPAETAAAKPAAAATKPVALPTKPAASTTGEPNAAASIKNAVTRSNLLKEAAQKGGTK